jgi:hypothetical protein
MKKQLPDPPSSLRASERKCKITDEENEYLTLLGQNKTFREMAIELGMTVDEVEAFGYQLFSRIFDEHKKTIMFSPILLIGPVILCLTKRCGRVWRSNSNSRHS